MPKKTKPAKATKLKKTNTPKSKSKKPAQASAKETETIISSKVVYQGPLFRVLHDKLIEPGGKPTSAMSSATMAASSSSPSTIQRARKIRGS